VQNIYKKNKIQTVILLLYTLLTVPSPAAPRFRPSKNYWQKVDLFGFTALSLYRPNELQVLVLLAYILVRKNFRLVPVIAKVWWIS